MLLVVAKIAFYKGKVISQSCIIRSLKNNVLNRFFHACKHLLREIHEIAYVECCSALSFVLNMSKVKNRSTRKKSIAVSVVKTKSIAVTFGVAIVDFKQIQRGIEFLPTLVHFGTPV